LEAFVGPCPSGQEAAHLDGDPANNRLDNLAWKTPVENMGDQEKHQTLNWGERHGGAKLTEADVIAIRQLRSFGRLWKEIRHGYPEISMSTLIEAGTGVTFRHIGGFVGPSARSVRMRNTRVGKANISPACRPGA
jgi:hypothetical protein